KTMYGRLTDNAQKPVIPEPGSLKIKVDASVSDLSIRFPSKEGHLKIESGGIKFNARPRLAQNESGMRLSPTPNTRFDKVRFNKIKGILVNKDVEVPVDISDGGLSIQVGLGEEGDENSLKGSLTLGRYPHSVPSDNAGLDPKYDREKFIKSYACK